MTWPLPGTRTVDGQTTENQLMALEAEAERRGLDVVRVFDVTASGYTG